jgi:hypothetical protein
MNGRAKNSARPRLRFHLVENRAGFELSGGIPFFDTCSNHTLNPMPWMLLHARRGSNPARTWRLGGGSVLGAPRFSPYRRWAIIRRQNTNHLFEDEDDDEYENDWGAVLQIRPVHYDFPGLA